MRQGITTQRSIRGQTLVTWIFIASGTNIGEHKVSGALSFGNADISESHKLDGCASRLRSSQSTSTSSSHFV